MPVLHIYCDESSTAERYMLFGGVITTETNAGDLSEVIDRWRTKHGMHRELKWGKVSRQKLPAYCSLIDLFAEHARQGFLHFNVIVFDTHQIDYKTYHQGRKELGFYRFYYRFVLYKFGIYAHDASYSMRVFLDERSELDAKRLEVMQIVLNRGIRKRYGLNTDVVRSVEAQQSHQSNLMQLADVIMGAVGFHCNGLHRRLNASPARRALAAHIAERAGLRELSSNTNPRRADFGIWRFKFNQRRKE
jgi:hypothetical protein